MKYDKILHIAFLTFLNQFGSKGYEKDIFDHLSICLHFPAPTIPQECYDLHTLIGMEVSSRTN